MLTLIVGFGVFLNESRFFVVTVVVDSILSLIFLVGVRTGGWGWGVYFLGKIGIFLFFFVVVVALTSTPRWFWVVYFWIYKIPVFLF